MGYFTNIFLFHGSEAEPRTLVSGNKEFINLVQPTPYTVTCSHSNDRVPGMLADSTQSHRWQRGVLVTVKAWASGSLGSSPASATDFLCFLGAVA